MRSLQIIILATGLLLLNACKGKDAPAQEQAAEESHHEEEGPVALSGQQIKAVGIVLAPVEQKNLGVSVKVNGKLEVPAQNKAAVTSLAGGILQQLFVHPGSSVKKGQLIAVIANTELAGLQQNLISVNAQLKLAQLEYDRQDELVKGNAAPLKNLQRAQAELSSLKAQQVALQKQLAALGLSSAMVNNGSIASTLALHAPISGTISDIRAQIGSRVDASTPVAEIVDNSELHLDLFVYEKDLPSIQKGQTIHFTLTNSPGREYDAKIFSIGTAFADASKTVPVHAEVISEKTGLIEGMNVTAVISIGSRTAPALPDDAIVTNGGKDYIFIRVPEKETAQQEEKDHTGTVHFEKIQVVKGATDLGFTEIHPVRELPPDAMVVVKGAFFIMAKATNTGDHEH